MYVPDSFMPPDADVRAFLAEPGAVHLVTSTATGLRATLLPMVYDAPGSRSGLGEHGALLGHVAIKNDQWREPAIGESLAIVRGPDAYITPSWYVAKREHGRVVPTWNYTLVHAYGRLVVHEDAAWLEANVRRLVEAHEAARAEPWAVDDAPRTYIEGQLRAIVGVELLIDRIEAKAKLSQNRSDADVEGTIEGLAAGSPLERAVADAMARDR